MSRGRAGSCSAAARETPSGGLQRMRLSSWERMNVCASSVRSQIQTEVWHTRLSAAAGCLPEDELSTRRRKPVWAVTSCGCACRRPRLELSRGWLHRLEDACRRAANCGHDIRRRQERCSSLLEAARGARDQGFKSLIVKLDRERRRCCGLYRNPWTSVPLCNGTRCNTDISIRRRPWEAEMMRRPLILTESTCRSVAINWASYALHVRSGRCNEFRFEPDQMSCGRRRPLPPSLSLSPLLRSSSLHGQRLS